MAKKMRFNKKSCDQDVFNSKVPVGVVFTMKVQGLGIARSLAREGIPVLAVDHQKNSFGLYSKYVTPIISPNADKEEHKFIEFLLHVGKKLRNKGVLFPTHDNELLVLSKHRSVLKDYFLYPMADYEVIDSCVDKFKMYPRAEEIGIPIPRTFFPKSLKDVQEIGENIRYPYILKPHRHEKFVEVFGRTAVIVENKDELLENYKKAVDENLRVMIQEIIRGRAPRLYTLGSYADKNSNLLGIFTARKIRQFPSDFGTLRVAEPVEEPEIIRLGRKLIKHMRYHGVSQVEFKKDPQDNQFKLMEINARNWMWVSMTTAYGVNLPAISYWDTVGKKIDAPVYPSKKNIKWVYMGNDFLNCCLGGYKRRGHPEESLSVFQWFRSIKGKKELAIFSWADPLPYVTASVLKLKEYGALFIKSLLKKH